MAETAGLIRFAVVGEGPSEHGDSAAGPPLALLSTRSKSIRQGVLVIMVERLLRERFNREAKPVCWVPPIRDRHSRRLTPRELLTDGHSLQRLLDALLRPVRRIPETPSATVVVLSVDSEFKEPFFRARRGIPRELEKHVIPLVFEPELEVLFTACKKPLEDACGLVRCTSAPPSRGGKPKQSVEEWLRRSAANRRLDCDLRDEIARHLDLGPESPLLEILAFQELLGRLEQLGP